MHDPDHYAFLTIKGFIGDEQDIVFYRCKRDADSRAVFSITVADSDETALLKQEIGLKPRYARGNTLFFHEAPGMIERIRGI